VEIIPYFEIGNVRAESGDKSIGFIPVSETAITTVRMPIVIINGSEAGPKVCLTGGVHGGEYSSIEAVIRAVNFIKPENLSGILFAVPIVNMAAFEARGPQGGLSTAFNCPIDCLNLNRVFPGHPNGTISHRTAYVLLNEVIASSDYYMDFHGGDLNEELLNNVMVPDTGVEKVDKESKEILARSFNCQIVNATSSTTSSIGAAAKLGIPALSSESGGYGRLNEEAVQFHFDGIINALKRLKMMEGTPSKTPKQITRSRHILTAKKGGLFYGLPLGTKVKKDEVIGKIKDVFGSLVYAINAPADGIISFKRAILPCSTGDRLFAVFPDIEPAKPPPVPPYP
jgi:predicted deacylase